MGEISLVGDQVGQHVDLLHSQHERDGFTFVEMVAPSGTGKSRTVREFYRRLASEQLQPGYWSMNLPTGTTSDPVSGRKVIGPPHHEFSAPAGAVPGYLWLSLCPATRADGADVSALPQIVEQLATHEIPLVVAALGSRSSDGAVAWLRDELVSEMRNHAKDAVSEKAVAAAERLVDFGLPGAGSAVGLTRRFVDRKKRQKNQLAAIADGHEFKANPGALVERLRDELADIAGAGIKIVLAIEDAHLMDEGTARLIRGLREQDVDCLVIACVWPESTDRETYARLSEKLRPGGAPAGYQTVTLAPWTKDDLRALVLAQHPATSDEVVDALVARFTTPLTLLLCLSLETVRTRSREGRLEISVRAVAALRNDPDGLMRQRWNELDKPVQQALTLTMAMTGSQGFEDGLTFVRSVARAIGSRSDAAFEEGLSGALVRVQWLAELVEGVDGYREPLVARIVKEEADIAFVEEEELLDLAKAVWAELEPRLVDAGARLTPAAEDEVVARWSRAIVKKIDPVATEALALCDLVEVQAHLNRRDPASALAILDAAGSSPKDAAVEMGLERQRYRAQRDAGRLAAAVETSERLLPLLDADARDEALALRFDRAHWKRTLGRLEEARDEYAALVRSLEDQSDRTPEDLLVAKIEHASALGYLGDTVRAESELAQLVEECIETMGPEHPLTLRCERSRWRWAGAGRHGRLLTACTGLQDVWERMEAVLGPDHPSTLFALSNLAHFTSRRGNHAEAKTMLDACAAGRQRALGPLHPHTIDSLRNAAREAAHLDPASAESSFRALLDHELSGLDDAAPLVLSTKVDLAIALGRSGREAEARAAVAELVDVIGESPSRTRLLDTIGEYGDVSKTVEQIQSLADGLGGEPASRTEVETLRSWISTLENLSGA